LPGFLERKERLFSPKTSREELIHWGDRYLEADRVHDAVAFYRQAGHEDGLKRVRERAVDDGDVMLFQEALDGMDPPDADPREWSHLARQAEAGGRWQDALKAYERLQDERGLQRVKESIRTITGSPPPEEAPDHHEEGG
jgi:hypothetical protein